MGEFDIQNGDLNELLNKTNEPLRGLKVYDYKGRLRKIKVRCELCAFCEVIEESDALKCSKSGLMTVENGFCDDFNITIAMLQDIYNDCIR